MSEHITVHPDTKEVLIDFMGFKLKFVNQYDLLHLLELLTYREVEFKDAYDQRLAIDSKGSIRVVSIDPWVNAGWVYGNAICHTADLAEEIVLFGELNWLK